MKKYLTINNFTFEVLNEKTKKAKSLIDAFNRSVNNHGLRYLKDCYNNASEAKKSAYNSIKAFSEKLSNKNGVFCYHTITGFNCMAFSMCVFINDYKNGVNYYYYFTAKNSYLIIEKQ